MSKTENTLRRILQGRAGERPGDPIFTFLPAGEEEEIHLTWGELDRRARAVAARIQQLGARGEHFLLLHPPGLDQVVAVYGCLYAGAVAVLSLPPHRNRPTPRLQAIVRDASPRAVLTTRAVRRGVEGRLEHSPELEALPWIEGDALAEGLEEEWREPEVGDEDLVLLQYTSGSTGRPRGVMLSQRNLHHNLSLIRDGFEATEEDVGVSWLPGFHDMGLLGGILGPVYTGVRKVLMPPAAFLQRPLRWLRTISRYRATVSGGPDFAYRLCAERITPEQLEELDLSCWRLAFCGAEPIRARTLERFAETFSGCGFRRRAFYPCYGMAETTLIVSGARVSEPPVLDTVSRRALGKHLRQPASVEAEDAQTLVGCGRPLPGMRVRIVDPESRRPVGGGGDAEGVGEIWVAGDSVASGYWRSEEESRETFGAFLAGEGGDGPYLRTGDLGYLHDGELFVTGRLKDLVIVRGQNHYPQDIERTVEESHPALEPGGGAAFSVEGEELGAEGGGERLVIVHELTRGGRGADGEEVIAALRRAVAEEHGLAVEAVALIRPRSLPRTTSGKVRRRACRQAFLDGRLETEAGWRRSRPVAASASEDAAGIRAWLASRIAELAGLAPEEIDPREPLACYGLDSAQAVGLAGELEDRLGRRLDATLVYDHPTLDALSDFLAGADGAEANAGRRTGDGGGRRKPRPGEPVAVVGIGCRFPGASGPRAFWRLLSEGVDAVTEVPAERWDPGVWDGPAAAASGNGAGDGAREGAGIRWGGFLQDLDLFDPAFFGISLREAEGIDPQQRLLLETAWEALEDAGLVPEELAGSRTGVFVGISTNDYGRLQERDPATVDAHGATGNALSIAANRLSYTLDLRGPSLAVDTACSSSLVAVDLACRSLAEGDCELALVGGVNVILSPVTALSFGRAGAMASDGRCKAFDARADGFVRSEGAACVALKPLASALADGDPIYAVLRGTAVNQDGRSNGLMAPSGPAQEEVIRDACRRAGVAPGDVRYVEAHGTGTLLGDPIEARALARVLGAGRPPDRPLVLGSVKTNLGHLEAAAGLAGLIKVALALEHRRLPASLHFRRPNPHIRFDEWGLRVQSEPGPWPTGEGPLLAGVSSFGFGGTNAHAVLEEAPVEAGREAVTGERAEREEPEARLLVLSARGPEALAERAGSLRSLVGAESALRLDDLCHSAAVRRQHHEHRLAVAFRDRGELEAALDAFASGRGHPRVAGGRGTPGHRPRLAFVFSGQGPQWWGMGSELAASEPVFRHSLEASDRILAAGEGGWSLSAELAVAEQASRLDRTEIAQPALVAVQIALTELLRHWGVDADAVVGHSLGEISAAWAAGALSLEEALGLARERGRRMESSAAGGAMALVGLGRERAGQALAGYRGRLAVAAVNGPAGVVVSGDRETLDLFLDSLGEEVFRQPLSDRYAFHGPAMTEIGEALAHETRLAPQPGRLPFFSTLTASRQPGESLDGAYWGRQAAEPVRFAETVEALWADGVRAFVEIGPHPVLAADLRACLDAVSGEGDPPLVLTTLRRGEAERAALLASVGALWTRGFALEWRRLLPDGGRAIRLPTYPWQRRRCWREPRAGVAGIPGGPGQTAAGDHPLLGQRLELAGGGPWIWDGEISTRRARYLEDHRVEGAVVVPATTHLDLVLAAARQAALGSTDGETAAAGALREIRFLRPLVVPDQGSRRVQIRLDGRLDGSGAGSEPGSARFRILSRAAGSNGGAPSDDAAGEWILHASGLVETGSDGEEPERVDFAELRGRCREEVPAEVHYRRLTMRGLDYGPRFRGIARVWRGAGEALGEIRVPPELETGAGDLLLHPAVLDACGQVLLTAAGDAEGGDALLLPSALDRLTVRAPLPDGGPGLRLWSHARLRRGGGLARWVGDARLLDEEGRVLAAVEGMELRILTPGAPSRDADGWLYELHWEPAPAPRETAGVAAGAAAGAAEAGTWILLGGREPLTEQLATRVSAERGRAIRVFPGVSYGRLGEDRFEIRPGVREDLARLLDEVAAEPPLRGVLHLWSLGPPPGDLPVEAALEQIQTRGFATAVGAVQELAERTEGSPVRLWLVTRGAQSVGGGDRAAPGAPPPWSPFQAPLWGLGRTLAQELPALWGGLVDLDPASASAEAARETAGRLWQAVRGAGDETQMALRGGSVQVARLVRGDRTPNPGAPAFRADASYLVTGGLGGLGLETARWMAESGARRLILLGRSALPPRTEWAAVSEERVARQIAAVRDLEARGLSVHLAAVDVADEQALGAFFDAFRGEGWPAIRGVVHAAGALQDQTVLRLDAANLAAVFRAKVLGAWLLHRLCDRDPLDFFVLFSSAASLLGSAGQAGYAAANAFLDALAHHRRSQGLAALSVNWGPWEEVGMTAAPGAGRLLPRGVGSIPVREGFEILGRLLAGPTETARAGARIEPQVAVLPFAWDRIFEERPEARQAPFLSHLAAEREDREAVDPRRDERRRQILAAAPGERRGRLLEVLREELAAVVGLAADAVDPDSPLNTLGIDSLMAVEFKSRLERDLDLRLPMVALMEGPSLVQLADRVADQLWPGSEDGSEEGSKRPAPAARGPAVIELRATGSRPPFFCVHSGVLEASCYRGVVDGLGPDQPFYVLQPPGLDASTLVLDPSDGNGGDPRLEESAARCLDAVRSIQPRGPYYLGGWSLGGVLAFLTAQLLAREDEEVRLLALFDSPAPLKGGEPVTADDADLVPVFARYLAVRHGEELPVSAEDFAELELEARLELLSERAKASRALPAGSEAPRLRDLFRIYRHGLERGIRQLSAVGATVYPHRITLFRASRPLDLFERIFPEPTEAWSRLTAQPLEVRRVEGDHYTMFLEPHVQDLAAGLQTSLDRAARAERGSG